MTIGSFRVKVGPQGCVDVGFFSGAGFIRKMPGNAFLVDVGVASGLFAEKDNATATILSMPDTSTLTFSNFKSVSPA